ncbi:retrotransposon protein [Tanacetum coccineum]|uniref:Retrotransposon protein n=1 Tax=Tanacetum coccineum TaxID=301880 RepID=A0ABQ4WH76_9ASTR
MILTTNTTYPSRKIRRIHACTHQRPQRKQAQYVVSREEQYADLRPPKKKVKSLALKANVTREQTSDDSDSQGGSDEDIDEEEKAKAFNLLARNFQKFFRKGNQLRGGNRFGNGANRKPKENKAFVRGAWSDSEEGDEHQNDATCLMAIDSQEVVSKPSSSNYDLNIINLQKENKELLEFNKDFTKTLEKLLKEKCSLENENLKLSSKINDLEIEVKKLENDKEVIEPCKTYDVLTKEVDSLNCDVSKLQVNALNFSKFKESSIALDDVCLKCDLLPVDWIVDSGCTKHMTENRRLFASHKAYDGGHVIFGSNLKGKVVNKVSFIKVDCTISKNGKMLAKGHRRNGLYMCKLGDNSKQQICLASVVDNSMLWHRRLGHANMRESSLTEPKSSSLVEDDRIDEPIVQDLNGSPSLQVNVSDEHYPKSLKEARGHPIEQVIEIEAKEQLPIIAGYLLHCIEFITPFNFAYFVAKCMNYLNDVAIPYARIITMLFEHIKNQHPNDTSRMVEVDDIPPM